MSNVTAIKKTESNLQEKSEQILEAIFGSEPIDEVFRVFLNNNNNTGKIYLPLCQSIAGLVNTPVDFKVQVEVREDKTVVHF